MGRLLGDPEVWDDSPARPRPAARGLVGLAIGGVAGLLLAFAVVPRPDPPPPEIRLPPSAEAPRLQLQKQVLYSAGLGGGPMLVSRSGRLEQVEVDGTGRRVVAQNLRAGAVVGPDPAGVLVAVDSGVVTRVDADGRTRRLGPGGFVAGGLAGAGRRLVACPDPAGRPPDAGLLLAAVGGRASPVRLGCPVAWAARGGLFAGAGGVMLHLYLTGRRRAFELAVLEVFGARRRDLWGSVAVEQGSLVGYGVLCGGLIGLLVALVALPAIPQFADRPTVPPPVHTPDWAVLGLALGLAVLLVGLGLAAVVAALVRQARPALLREEEL